MTNKATANDQNDDTRSLVLRGASRFMQPIVRLLLKVGITHAEFAELSKSVFVDVASSDYGIRGRKANNSRIAILTGLGRKQVRQQLDLLAQEQLAGPSQMSPATRVISAWHEDPEFLDDDSRPLVLGVDGPHPSFETLARKYAGDLPISALLKELRRVNAVADEPDGRLEIISRSFLSTTADPDYVRMLSTSLQDLGSTIVHNMDPPSESDRRMQRYVVSENMPHSAIRKFKEFATVEVQTLLERFDGWLSKREVPIEKRPATKTKRTGVGVYFFEDN